MNILWGSCTSSKKQNMIFSAPVVELYADSISIPPVLLAVTQMFIAHDTLIVYEQQKDTLFSFWKLPECQYLFSAGTKGQGPNDFLMLDKTFVETDKGFKTFEIATNRIKEVGLDLNKQISLLSEKQINAEQMPLNRFLFLANDSYCFLSKDENYEFALLDKKEQIHYFGKYPIDLMKKREDEVNSYVYNKLMVAKPDGEKFAAFYAYIKMMRIYDRKGNLLKECVMEVPTDIISDNEKRTVYYSSFPFASEKYIYALIESGKRKYLEVWSWDGKPVAHYLLDKNIDMFTISLKDNKVYAIDKNVDDVIYTYKLQMD